MVESAHSMISSCVSYYCTNTVDITQAVSLYDGYCAGTGEWPSLSRFYASISDPNGLGATAAPTQGGSPPNGGVATTDTIAITSAPAGYGHATTAVSVNTVTNTKVLVGSGGGLSRLSLLR